MKIMPFESQKMVAMTFRADGTVFAFFGACLPGKVHCFDSFFIFWYAMMDPCFINSYETAKKLLRIALLNKSKHYFEVVIRFRLLSTVSKRGTPLADSFVIGSDEMATISTISLIFIRRSANTISWILWIISFVVTSIERPGRSSFRTDIRHA
jgi:type II secretory pathway component PulF